MVNRLNKIGLFFLTDAFRRSAYYIKVNGFGTFLKVFLVSIAEAIVKHREFILFEKDLSTLPGPTHPKRRVNIRIGTDHDVPRLTRLLPQWSARIFRDRLSRGNIFFIAEIDNQIVHQVWTSFRDTYVPWLGKKIPLREGEVYLYDIYTMPESRGNRIFPAVTSKVLRYLKDRGCKTCFFLVDLKTHPSTKMYEKTFDTKEGTLISYWRILGLRRYRYEPYWKPK